MLPDLLERVSVVCLRCRTQTSDGVSLHTLELARVARKDGAEVLDGTLRCTHCAAEYPILDGVAIVHPDPAALVERDLGGLFDAAFDPETLALLGRDVPDSSPLARHLELLSIYLEAHHGDRGGGQMASPALLDFVARQAPVERALELGASVGRWTEALAARAQVTVALDQSLGALRRARRLLRGEPVSYARRVVGRYYAGGHIEAPPASPPVLLLCGDALDPPLPPANFDRVVALNLLDAVVHPRQLLTVATGLCAEGGELIVSSPYAWQTGHVAEDARLGGADPASAVAAILAGIGMTVLDDEEATWSLRRDDRTQVVYRLHLLRARR